MLYVAVSERLDKMRPMSNLPSNNFISLSAENNIRVVLQLQHNN